MTYDLRHLRLHGRIQRIPRTRTYTPDRRPRPRRPLLHQGSRTPLAPLIANPDQPPTRLELRRALATIDQVITNYADSARLAAA